MSNDLTSPSSIESKPQVSESNGPKFKTAVALEHKILAGNFHYFTFKTDTPFVYKPGQYISVKVADQRMNDYSVAGNNGPNEFHLLVDVSPGGPGSKYFESLKTGDVISYLGPFGVFGLQINDGAKHILFLGTGSGCTPLRTILEDALKNINSQIPIIFYFGLRYQSDIFWKEYFEKLAQDHPNFKFELVLSKPDSGWQGLSGHITDYVKRDNPAANQCSAYLCGNPQMIEEAKQLLISHGCPSERIYFEKF